MNSTVCAGCGRTVDDSVTMQVRVCNSCAVNKRSPAADEGLRVCLEHERALLRRAVGVVAHIARFQGEITAVLDDFARPLMGACGVAAAGEARPCEESGCVAAREPGWVFCHEHRLGHVGLIAGEASAPDYEQAVKSAGFHVTKNVAHPMLGATPEDEWTLWCDDCGRDSGFHWPGCSKYGKTLEERRAREARRG